MNDYRSWIIPAAKASCIAGVLLFAVTAVIAQNSGYRPPRTADGKPDLNGIWQVLDASANWDIEGHAAQAGPVPELGAAYAVPPGLGIIEGADTIPYLPSALAQKKENFANRLTEDPEIKCFLPGVPRATYMPYPFQIFETSKYVMISYEYDDAVRTINMGNPGPSPADSWMGWSVGHWDGDTLVVDVTGLNEQSWFDRAGDFHSDELPVVERYTRTGPDTMNYEATIDDPKVFSMPWKIRVPLYRHVEKDFQLMEYKCVPFAEPVLYGGLERTSAKDSAKH